MEVRRLAKSECLYKLCGTGRQVGSDNVVGKTRSCSMHSSTRKESQGLRLVRLRNQRLYLSDLGMGAG
jgi:hypothetical protein